MMNRLLIGYACGMGAERTECADGPQQLIEHIQGTDLQHYFNTTCLLTPNAIDRKLASIPIIAHTGSTLASLCQKSDFYLTLGGDHTSAIGSHSGGAAKLAPQGPMGLLWIDAHLDSHTPESSLSKNPHGMPLASLLGVGDPQLTQIGSSDASLMPQHVCVLGVRSYEPEELALLSELGVRLFTMDEIHQRGLTSCINEAWTIVQTDTAGFAISFDIDAIDPEDAPGTGTREPNGIRGEEMLSALQTIPNIKQLIGMDMTEFNPHRDQQHRTEDLIMKLISTILKQKFAHHR